MVEYKDKVVCFIDILGFGEMVDEHVSDPGKIYSIVGKMRTAIEDWSHTEITQNIDLQLTQFSDSIVFSFAPGGHYFMNFSFFKELQIAMVHEGVVFRGGITYGKIYHDREFVFGPAMNEAYRLESGVAGSARIIIDESALGLENEGRTIRDYTGQFVFSIDPNGYSYIDYIVDVSPYERNPEEYYKKLKAIIVKGLQHTKPRVLEKYQWMKTEYNKAQKNFRELELL